MSNSSNPSLAYFRNPSEETRKDAEVSLVSVISMIRDAETEEITMCQKVENVSPPVPRIGEPWQLKVRVPDGVDSRYALIDSRPTYDELILVLPKWDFFIQAAGLTDRMIIRNEAVWRKKLLESAQTLGAVYGSPPSARSTD